MKKLFEKHVQSFILLFFCLIWSPYAEANSSNEISESMMWSVSELGHSIGRVDGDGWSANMSQDSPGALSFGPYVTNLATGTWNVTWPMMIDNNTANNLNVVRVEVLDADTWEILGYRNITRQQFVQTYQYQDFNLQFTSVNPSHRLEFRVHWYGQAYIKLKNVSVQSVASVKDFESWAVGSLGHNIGRSDNGGWSANPTYDQQGYLSYGPYESGLSPGKWTVGWSLLVDNITLGDTKVARIEVSSADAGGQILAYKDVTSQEFYAPNHLQKFSVDFMNTNPGHRLEFRVYWYGEAYMQLKSIIAYTSQDLDKRLTWAVTDAGIGHSIGRVDGDGWAANMSQDSPGALSFGPYVTNVTSGTWSVTWPMMIDNNTANNSKVVRVEIFDTDSNEILAYQDITRQQFVQAYQYQDFNLQFTSIRPSHRLEFRVHWYGQAYTKLKNVSVQSVAPVRDSKSWAVEPLGHNIGRSDNGGWSANPTYDQQGYLSYGPYESRLSPGKWTVEWSLIVDNNTLEHTKIARIEVYDADAGGQLLAYKDVMSQEFVFPNHLQKFSVDFMNANPGHRLEFKVYWYGAAYMKLNYIFAYQTKSREQSDTYNSSNHLETSTIADGKQIKYEYDKNGNITKKTIIYGMF